MKNNGATLEALVRRSISNQEAAGLWLLQAGPRFVGKVGEFGHATGRIVGRGGLDFVGDFLGTAVTFDTKACASKTSFPLANIANHQALIVNRAHERGAIAFFLVEFTQLSPTQYFALTWPVLKPYWEAHRRSEYFGTPAKASIPLAVFQADCLSVARGRSGLDLVTAIRGIQERGP